MANRIIGNVLIVDSAMGNNFVLDSAGIISSSGRKFMVNAIAVYQTSTAGSISITGADTSQGAIFRSDWISLASDTAGKLFANNPSWFSFGQPQPFDSIKAPVVTAGTVYFYFV